ncbi:MAG: response regulator [candidate division KSB1 bacterium]|nr:response regulator [candidate division KSB1 bacterium]MDZ7364546.1 response regulator [candidate division KSB1 bacterium]MDZ7405751.1 response regulator [candidate division KSB1 bacterium]
MARVLLVEDEENLRLLYRVRLEQIGYDIAAAESAAQALETLAREEVDAVVLDLKLPDYGGLQLLDEIVSRQPFLPIIIHTGYELWGDDFRSWGAAAYVVKSPDLSELKEALARFAPNRPRTGSSPTRLETE